MVIGVLICFMVIYFKREFEDILLLIRFIKEGFSF
jgi:hypothetical protein